MTKGELPELIRGLLDPAAYPYPVGKVELVQTHISYVLLAGDFVYKVKKPVDFGFLDFTTLAKRRYYCRQEVVLNSRLCSGTYLGVVRVTQEGGRPRMEGRGKPIEYAVKMRRLPAEGMMDRLLAAGRVSPGMIEAVGERLAAFHARAATSPAIARYGARAIRIAWEENFEQWAPYLGDTITPEQDELLQAYVRSFFVRQRDLLKQRETEGRIRDCHGDVRSDAVCFLEDQICIFDCIEFNRRLRYTDVAGDVGFLAMDVDFRGRPGLAQALVRRYAELADDADLLAVIDFYKCYRACVRGKVESFRLSQPEVGLEEKEQAREAARRHFALAVEYASRQPPPVLVVTCGLVASGKTVVARALGEATDMLVLSSDVVRKELAGLMPRERRFEPFGKGIYSQRFSDRTYKALLERAREALDAGRSLIIDATFGQRRYRQRARGLARAMGARFLCVECRAEEGVIRQRLEERLWAGRDASDARWEIYEAEKQVFEPVDELPPAEHLVLDCGRPIAECVAEVRRRLGPVSASPSV